MTNQNDTNGADAPDPEVQEELRGVPDDMLEGDDEAAEAEGEGGDLSEALAQLRADLETSKQDVLYARAETQNVRRRLEKDVSDARQYGATGFARDILSVADNLSRALDHVPEALREDDKSKRFIEGIEATQREIDKVFAQHGISRIAAVGLPLDPNQHQAMMEVPTDDAEPGTIVQEMQAGYMLRDRLLRPAMVGVAKKPD
ncbi:nucleotide exchange factor GrpE [Pseudoblastomonas halimionae]|uniref:Protein GrpE n=1 Tax=Alteriqipengyuania halimionae TaxID=1926630 RepID=A0A6I4U5K9_9SPHN|nr:nucleotide exchange factor GrpE [Alteriqipengyuania halimionae]MXP09537.1 nucleotide exchange factor GrpE [Alteriqipengyuania halimionae]